MVTREDVINKVYDCIPYADTYVLSGVRSEEPERLRPIIESVARQRRIPSLDWKYCSIDENIVFKEVAGREW